MQVFYEHLQLTKLKRLVAKKALSLGGLQENLEPIFGRCM